MKRIHKIGERVAVEATVVAFCPNEPKVQVRIGAGSHSVEGWVRTEEAQRRPTPMPEGRHVYSVEELASLLPTEHARDQLRRRIEIERVGPTATAYPCRRCGAADGVTDAGRGWCPACGREQRPDPDEKYTDEDLSQANLDGRFEIIEAVCRHLRDTGRDDIAHPLWEKFRPSAEDERRRDAQRRERAVPCAQCTPLREAIVEAFTTLESAFERGRTEIEESEMVSRASDVLEAAMDLPTACASPETGMLKEVAGSTPAGTSTVAGSRMPEGEWGVDAQPQAVEDSRKSPHFSLGESELFRQVVDRYAGLGEIRDVVISDLRRLIEWDRAQRREGLETGDDGYRRAIASVLARVGELEQRDARTLYRIVCHDVVIAIRGMLDRETP